MPRAYFIGQFDVRDPEAYVAYRAQAPATIEKFGEKFIVRAGRVEQLEGEAPLPRVVVIEFPSFAQAKAWYESAEYKELIPLRKNAAVGRTFFVEGCDDEAASDVKIR